MNKEIIGTIDTSNIKRCYVEGVAHTELCPKCNRAMDWDSSDYFGYPENKSEQTMPFYCDNCDEYFSLPIIFETKAILTITGELKNE